jgi:hypothetical protein
MATAGLVMQARPDPRHQAHPMTKLEWCWALMRGPDYEGGWLQYVKTHGIPSNRVHAQAKETHGR